MHALLAYLCKVSGISFLSSAVIGRNECIGQGFLPRYNMCIPAMAGIPTQDLPAKIKGKEQGFDL